jgi:hypothetical protein
MVLGADVDDEHPVAEPTDLRTIDGRASVANP